MFSHIAGFFAIFRLSYGKTHRLSTCIVLSCKHKEIMEAAASMSGPGQTKRREDFL